MQFRQALPLVWLIPITASLLFAGCGENREQPAQDLHPQPPQPQEPSPKLDERNQLSFERMGAGAPAGWKVDGEEFTWTPDPTKGPLGIGAARIAFGENGSLTLIGPAQALREGISHACGLWVRSEPAGATVRLTLRDNNPNGTSAQTVAFDATETASDEWRRMTARSTLPEARKGCYYLTLEARGSDCTLWLDGLWLGEWGGKVDEAWRPPTHRAGVVLKPVADWGLVTGDAVHKVQTKVVGVTDSACRLELRVTNTLGVTGELPSIPIDTTGVWEHETEITGEAADAFGMVRVEAQVVDENGDALSPRVETLLARAPEPVPGPLPESYFGVHVALREPDVAVAAKLGYKWCRIHDADKSTKWGFVEPEPGQWTWFDERIDLARSKGLRVLGLLDGSPPWESGTDEGGYFSIYHAPRDVDHWRTYVRQVVGHYAGRIDDWEVWNEPWDMQRFFQGGSPQLYAELLGAAYTEAKVANPNCTVVGIDTYPFFWEQLVLQAGAYPHYDLLSFHRYDPSLHGRPHDAIARVAQRLRDAQEPYGDPKPLCFSEGGPDVAVFHGSFFSFAEPAATGDWSLAAYQYPRMFLSSIAAGVKYFIAYSIHNDPRHGQAIHMLVEPEFLLRPMHLSLAALAHFVDGAQFTHRLTPAQDVSAFVFQHHLDRPFADRPSTVVALIADGAGAIDLPRSLPAGVRCFDRWGNPAEIPDQATRGIAYLVATGDEAEALLDALRTEEPEPGPATVEALMDQTVATLAGNGPALSDLFSAQASMAVIDRTGGPVLATRGDLRSDPDALKAFALPPDVAITDRSVMPAGEYAAGWMDLEASDSRWAAAVSAVRDGPEKSWRLISLTLVPADDTGEAPDVRAVLAQWERAMAEGTVYTLRDTLHPEGCCVCASSPNGEDFLFDDAEHMIVMLETAMLWGAATTSSMTWSHTAVTANVAVFYGTWDLVSMAFGNKPYAFTATAVRTPGGWKLVSLCAAAGSTNG